MSAHQETIEERSRRLQNELNARRDQLGYHRVMQRKALEAQDYLAASQHRDEIQKLERDET